METKLHPMDIAGTPERARFAVTWHNAYRWGDEPRLQCIEQIIGADVSDREKVWELRLSAEVLERRAERFASAGAEELAKDGAEAFRRAAALLGDANDREPCPVCLRATDINGHCGDAFCEKASR